MEHIAKRLLEKNQALVEAMEKVTDGKYYHVIEPFITGKLLSKIGKTEGSFIKKHDLIWAINDAFADEEGEELDY